MVPTVCIGRLRGLIYKISGFNSWHVENLEWKLEMMMVLLLLLLVTAVVMVVLAAVDGGGGGGGAGGQVGDGDDSLMYTEHSVPLGALQV